MSKKSRNVIFSKSKNPTSKIIQDLDAERMLTLLDFGPENQNILISTSTISMYENCSISIFPIFAGIGANGTLSKFIFSETHIGLVGEGLGIRQFAGITLERLMKNSLNLPFNLLVGGEGFISTNMTGSNNTSGWGGLGVRLDISL